MRNKIRIAIIITLIATMTGIAVAVVSDQLTATWTGSEIEAKAWNLMSNWYEIRFYAPSVLPDPTDSRLPPRPV